MRFCDKKIYQIIAGIIVCALSFVGGVAVIAILLLAKIYNPLLLGICIFVMFYGFVGAIVFWSSLITWRYYDRLVAQIILNNIVKINDLANCNNKSIEVTKQSIRYLIENNILVGYDLLEDKIKKIN